MPMNKWPAPDAASMNAFYGNPRGTATKASAAWERANIVDLIPPHTLYYPTADSRGHVVDKRGSIIKRLRVHRKVKDSLTRILQRIGDEMTPEEIHYYEIDICGGVYNYRQMRGGKALSMHSWGSAIDLSHIINAWKKKWTGEEGGMMPRKVIQIFEDEGWTFGGVWKTADAMHFEATNRGQKRTTSPTEAYGIMAPPVGDENGPEAVEDGPAQPLVTPDAPAPKPRPPVDTAPPAPAMDTVPAPIRTAPTPKVSIPGVKTGKETIVEVQDLLKKRGYAYVGASDGIMGPNTEAAIFAFRKANNLPPFDGTIDATLVAALVAGEDKQIAPERAEATVEQAAAKSEPVKAVVMNTNQVKQDSGSVSFWTQVLGWPALIGGFILKVFEQLGVSKEYIDGLKAIFGSIDPLFYVIAIGGGALYLAYRAVKATQAAQRAQVETTQAYQEGKVN